MLQALRLYTHTHTHTHTHTGNLLSKEGENPLFLLYKNKMGITLIALVVTIVVLLILARNNNKFHNEWE